MKTTLSLAFVLTIGMMTNAQTTSNPSCNNQFLIGGCSQKTNQADLKDLRSLSIESACIKAEYQKFKTATATRTGEEKKEMNEETQMLYNKYETIQIEISELSAKMAYQKYDQNKTSILALMDTNAKNDSRRDKIDHALTLVADAEQARITAIDMREEAYAETNNTAKLGTMDNASEKEQIALAKQSEAISLLEKAKLDTP